MFDKMYHLKKSASFSQRGDCYIHTEMKGGKHPQTVLCGDLQAMLWGICAEINRIGELSGTGFDETVSAVMAMKRIGFETARKECGEEMPRITPPEEKAIRESNKREADRANTKAHELEIELATTKAQIDKLNAQKKFIKQQAEERERQLMKEKQALSREITGLEARLREMEKQALWGNDDGR